VISLVAWLRGSRAVFEFQMYPGVAWWAKQLHNVCL
jgi:hypothetical protein